MSRLDYTAEEIHELCVDHNVDLVVMERMLDDGYDPDGRSGPSMGLDLDGEPGWCPECRYEHLDAPC